MNSLELISYRIPRPNAYSPARRLAGSPPRTAAPSPCRTSFVFNSRGGVARNVWSGRARGTAHLPSLTAHMGRNEPFSPNTNTLWSLGFLPLCGCRPLAKAIHPSASASGLFPLWLRAPRFVCAACSSHSCVLAGARGGSCLGEGRSPSPSSSSASFLQRPSSHNPLPRFH